MRWRVWRVHRRSVRLLGSVPPPPTSPLGPASWRLSGAERLSFAGRSQTVRTSSVVVVSLPVSAALLRQGFINTCCAGAHEHLVAR